MARIACLVGPEFEDAELTIPVKRLVQAGHEVELLGTGGGQRLVGQRRTASVTTDASVGERRPDMYGALLIPGGHSPDNLRSSPDVVQFVREFAATGRPIAAISRGPQLLIEAGLTPGVRMTAWTSVRTDLRNAGAVVVAEEPVVEDRQFITARGSADLDAFSHMLIEQLHRSEQVASLPPTALTSPPRTGL